MLAIMLLAVLPAISLGCKKSAVVKFCLSEEGTYQDCGIACDVTKDDASCAKWAEQTTAICAKATKVECQELCTKDKNPTACELAKTMK
jgi:hypothetical protein